MIQSEIVVSKTKANFFYQLLLFVLSLQVLIIPFLPYY